MKKFVVLLAAISSLVISCVTPQSNLHSSAIVILPNSYAFGNGVAIESTENNVYYILTVAHLCNPIEAALMTLQGYKDGLISKEDTYSTLQSMDEAVSDKAICSATILTPDNASPLLNGEAMVIAVDYDLDLMLLQVKLPFSIPTVITGPDDDLLLGTPIYAIVGVPSVWLNPQERLFFYDRSGSIVRQGAQPLPTRRDYMQTSMDIGPGASGSPVFDERTNRLIGLIGAVFSAGQKDLPIRTSLIIRGEAINKFINYVSKEMACDPKPNWPICRGEDDLCSLVRAEKSLVQVLTDRLLQREGSSAVPTQELISGGPGLVITEPAGK